MKLLCKKSNLARVQKFSSLRMTLTEEDTASCSRAFRKPKTAEEERYPKATCSTEKVFFEKIFLEWPNGR